MPTDDPTGEASRAAALEQAETLVQDPNAKVGLALHHLIASVEKLAANFERTSVAIEAQYSMLHRLTEERVSYHKAKTATAKKIGSLAGSKGVQAALTLLLLSGVFAFAQWLGVLEALLGLWPSGGVAPVAPGL